MCSLSVSSPEKDYCGEDVNERSLTYFLQSPVVCFLLYVFFLECVKTTQSTLFLYCCAFEHSPLGCRAELHVWAFGAGDIPTWLSLRWGDQLLRWNEQQGQPPVWWWSPLQWALLRSSQSSHWLHTKSLWHRLSENQGKTTTRISSFPVRMQGDISYMWRIYLLMHF